jgi:division protein CdvB (Snf7/Vps24/ESCRT-III family)
MSRSQDSTPRQWDGEHVPQGDPSSESMTLWLKSLEQLMASLESAPIAPEKKEEILHHMRLIRQELTEGRWPDAVLGEAATQMANEVGELEKIAQDWHALSIRMAQWVKAVSDALGVK